MVYNSGFDTGIHLVNARMGCGVFIGISDDYTKWFTVCDIYSHIDAFWFNELLIYNINV